MTRRQQQGSIGAAFSFAEFPPVYPWRPPPTSVTRPSPPRPCARLACGQAIAKRYRDAHESVGRYEELRAINDFCVSFDSLTYQQSVRDVSQFRKDMVLLK